MYWTMRLAGTPAIAEPRVDRAEAHAAVAWVTAASSAQPRLTDPVRGTPLTSVAP